MLTQKITATIRDVADFPKPGILFKDITPLLEDPNLCGEMADAIIKNFSNPIPDAIVGVESRGFFLGFLIANKLGIPFIPVRKAGKLPYKTISQEYSLEYGTAKVEMHVDSIKKGWNVLIHDDLLATGGTASAAAELIKMQDATVLGFSFIIDLTFLNGAEKLKEYSENVHSLVKY